LEGKGGKMPERTRVQKIIHGLTILARYRDCDINAEHDVIYAGTSDVTLVDKKELKECDWHWDEELKCWKRFV
jgi:hypothetical protein